ncbi:NUDIX domain-containing protein [Fictibacillus nanhaiensis]|uniref:NUDIX domain-containing protein n=1 Tax=Fictibacillus nanhaiensis TaxID=742169 RepID=UPI001C94A43A|nr:NUDIX domain-containing protein [Fictibacillus nanhaiensis]MBY6036433.1 NUDIX domain-containing protein [Fictibacillus nanhaiensis]
MHTHKGIYAICLNENGQLLVVKKCGGPYKNRLDLPGGTPEERESELETVVREVLEETGYTLSSAKRIGERCYEVPWNYKQWTFSHHTAVYYQCKVHETSKQKLADIPDQDSIGALWAEVDHLQEEWCSPLVWEAVQYSIEKEISSQMKTYRTWQVLQTPLYKKNNRQLADIFNNNKTS